MSKPSDLKPNTRVLALTDGGVLFRCRARPVSSSLVSSAPGLLLAFSGRLAISVLSPETEGERWCRGWRGDAAKAFETAHALRGGDPPWPGARL